MWGRCCRLLMLLPLRLMGASKQHLIDTAILMSCYSSGSWRQCCPSGGVGCLSLRPGWQLHIAAVLWPAMNLNTASPGCRCSCRRKLPARRHLPPGQGRLRCQLPCSRLRPPHLLLSLLQRWLRLLL